MAFEASGHKTLEADVHPGGKRDAILYSCSANTAHGARRTNEDKRRSVERLLLDAEWGQRSSRWIADKAAVSAMFVLQVKNELEKAQAIPTVNGLQLGKDGKLRPARQARHPAP